MFKFKMQDRVKDTVSGYEGIITVRCEYLNGCLQYCLSKTELDKDGKVQEGEYFDEGQLEKVKVKPRTLADLQKKPTGGPQRDQAPKSPR